MKAQKKSIPKKTGTFGWKKLLVVGAGLVLVVFMILSGMGTSWITGMKPAVAGDTAVIDYTIRDSNGHVIITTSQKLFNDTVQQGNVVFLTGQMSVGVNSTAAQDVVKVLAYNPQTGQVQFGLFSPELESISAGLVGMKKGEAKTVPFTTDASYERRMTVQEFEGIGGNISRDQVGDPFLIAFVEHPVVNFDNTTSPDLYISRIATITEKDPEGVNLSFGYSNAEIILEQINSK